MQVVGKVLAVRRLDFKDDNNQPVKGRQLWVCSSSEDPQWNGHEVLKIWIPDGDPKEADVCAMLHGDEVLIDFNRRGKPYLVG